jgi:hypothetical protein
VIGRALKYIKTGILGSKHYVLPSGFGDYFFKKAGRLIAVQRSMSEKQQNIIDETYKKSMDRAEQSETFEAMDYDIDLFGDRAFTDEE